MIVANVSAITMMLTIVTQIANFSISNIASPGALQIVKNIEGYIACHTVAYIVWNMQKELYGKKILHQLPLAVGIFRL